MQTIEKRKESVNNLVSNYGPLGPRHLLAAALLMRPRDDDKKDDRKTGEKAAA